MQTTPQLLHAGSLPSATGDLSADAMFQTAGRVVAIVTTHNRCDQLRQTVARLLDEPALHLAGLVVVDNASTDGTARFLRSVRDLRLQVLHLPRNTGGAGGFAAGLAYARTRFDPDWYLLMDDDARPMPGAMAMFHAESRAQWDAVVSAVYDPAGRVCELNRPALDPFASLSRFLRTVMKGRDGFHVPAQDYAAGTPISVDGASFVGFFLSRRGLALAGLPDARLFIYADDTLQTLRLSRRGGRIAFVPSICFEHAHEHMRGGAGHAERPLWKIYYQHRNALILYRFAAGWLFWPVCLIVLPRWALRLWAYPGRRAKVLQLYLRGVLHGVQGKTAVDHETVLRWCMPRR